MPRRRPLFGTARKTISQGFHLDGDFLRRVALYHDVCHGTRFGQGIDGLSRQGHCYDNAVAESFFSTLKNEGVHHQTYRTRDEASREICAFIEGFYNRQRLPQSLAYLSPLEFERRSSDS